MRVVELYKDYLAEADPTDLGQELASVKSNSLRYLIDIASGDSKDALQANKYLLEFSYRDVKRGRPTKDDLNYEIQRRMDVDARVGADYALYQGRQEQV